MGLLYFIVMKIAWILWKIPDTETEGEKSHSAVRVSPSLRIGTERTRIDPIWACDSDSSMIIYNFVQHNAILRQYDRIARSFSSSRRNWFSTAHENIDGPSFKALLHIAKIICHGITIEYTCSGPYCATNLRLKVPTFLDFLQNQLWIWVYAFLWRISDSLSVANLLFSSMNWTTQRIPFRVHSENEIEIRIHDPDWKFHDCRLILQ
jgi:hypothetical protein